MEKGEHKVNPWEVSGKIDYEKLIKEFGVSKLMKTSSEDKNIQRKFTSCLEETFSSQIGT